MSNDEKRDIEDRINDAMAKIVSDTAGEPQPEIKITDQLLTSRQDLRNQQGQGRSPTYLSMNLNLNLSLYPKRKSIRH